MNVDLTPEAMYRDEQRPSRDKYASALEGLVDPSKVIGEERSNSSYGAEHNKNTQIVTKEKAPPKSSYE